MHSSCRLSRRRCPLIDAKDDRTADGYKAYGALSLLDAPSPLLLLLPTVAAALKAAWLHTELRSDS